MITHWIGLGGLAKAGKSTVAKQLTLLAYADSWRPITISVANPMKEMGMALLKAAGVHPEEERIRLMRMDKGEPVPHLGGLTSRKILQTLGTEWGRDTLHKNFWSEIAERNGDRSDANVIIIDDIRYQEECDMIHGRGGMVFQLELEGAGIDGNHASEAMEYTPYAKIVNVPGNPQLTATRIWDVVLGGPL